MGKHKLHSRATCIATKLYQVAKSDSPFRNFSFMYRLLYVDKTTVAVSIVRIKATNLHSQKRASCSKSVDILQQLVATSRYQDAFAWLATACENKSVAICQQACCKLSTDLLHVNYFNKLVATCFNKLKQVCK